MKSVIMRIEIKGLPPLKYMQLLEALQDKKNIRRNDIEGRQYVRLGSVSLTEQGNQQHSVELVVDLSAAPRLLGEALTTLEFVLDKVKIR